MPPLRCEPGFHNEHSISTEVTRHRTNSSTTITNGRHVPDGTKETRHNLELAAKIEITHVGLVQRHVGNPFRRKSEHSGIRVEPFNLIVHLQIGKMLPRAAGNIQQRVTGRYVACVKKAPKLVRFRTEVFRAFVKHVVERGRYSPHCELQS